MGRGLSATAAFDLSRKARWLLLTAALLAAIARFVLAVSAARAGDWSPITAFGFSVVFPLALLIALLLMGPARSGDGVLMRLGVCIQLLLIISLPPFALYLALGIPVVFLVVEQFETRLPNAIHDQVTASLVVEVDR